MNPFSAPDKKPAALVVTIILLVTGTVLLAKAERVIAPVTTAPIFSLINFSLLLIAGLVITRYMGWGTRIGLRSRGIARSLPLFIIPLIAVSLPLLYGYLKWSAGEILAFILLALAIGFSEEVLFRGLLQEALLTWGVTASVLGSALFFGFVEGMGLILYSGNIASMAGIMVRNSGAGVCFAALRLRCKSLWPLIGLHAWADFVVFLSVGFTLGEDPCTSWDFCLIPRIIIGLLYAGYGMLLLRRYRHEPAFVQEMPEH